MSDDSRAKYCGCCLCCLCVVGAVALLVGVLSNPSLGCFEPTELNATLPNGTVVPMALVGESVAMTCAGEQVVVGAPSGDGFVQVSRLDFASNAYNSSELLVPPTLNQSGMFGAAVATDCTDGWLSVGEPLANASTGAVHIYWRGSDITDVSAQYDAVQQIDAPGTAELFGASLAFACQRPLLAVGAPMAESGGGRVYLYEPDENATWSLLEIVERPDDNVTSATAEFGSAVALACDGLTLAVGAPLDAGGSVAVYRRPNDTSAFDLAAVLSQSNQSDADFGAAVALAKRGHAVTVGAPRFDTMDAALTDAGRVYQFDVDATNTVTTRLTEPLEGAVAEAQFGSSVATSGDAKSLVVGSSSEPGSAMRFVRRDGAYVLDADSFVVRDAQLLGAAVASSFGGHEFASTSASNTTAEPNSTRVGVVDCSQRRGSSCPVC